MRACRLPAAAFPPPPPARPPLPAPPSPRPPHAHTLTLPHPPSPSLSPPATPAQLCRSPRQRWLLPALLAPRVRRLLLGHGRTPAAQHGVHLCQPVVLARDRDVHQQARCERLHERHRHPPRRRHFRRELLQVHRPRPVLLAWLPPRAAHARGRRAGGVSQGARARARAAAGVWHGRDRLLHADRCAEARGRTAIPAPAMAGTSAARHRHVHALRFHGVLGARGSRRAHHLDAAQHVDLEQGSSVHQVDHGEA